MFPIFLPHFRLYGVVSLHMRVLPYKYRKILEMLFKLMTSRETMGAGTCRSSRRWRTRTRLGSSQSPPRTRAALANKTWQTEGSGGSGARRARGLR